MKNPLVSVIVTTKNSAKTIENCLTSISKQTYKNIELLVVDNNSTDSTKQIAKKHATFVFNKGPERSTQRNFGINKSSGEYILFLDSDMSLSATVIEQCVKTITEKQVVGIYIPEVIAGDSFWSKVRSFERSFYNETVIDAVRFFPKKIVTEIGGFDEELFAGEDWDVNLRINKLGKTTSISAPLFHHEEDSNLITYLTKKSYYTDNLQVYRTKWKDNADVKKQFSPYYRFIGVFIEHNKWKKVVTHPFLFLCVIMLKCFVGLQFVLTKSKTNSTNEH